MFYLIAVQSVWLVRLQFEQIPRNKFDVLTQRTVSNSLSLWDQLEIMAIYSIVVDTILVILLALFSSCHNVSTALSRTQQLQQDV